MKTDLIKMASIEKSILEDYESYQSRFKDYVKALFKDTGLLRLELTLSYFEQHLPFPPSINSGMIREMLYVMPGVTRSSDRRLVRFPRYITEEDRANGAKEEVGTICWTMEGKLCRPFIFDAKYFLSPDEYSELKARNLVNFSAEGITYNDVRNCLRILQEEIPATDEVCAEYTFNCAPRGGLCDIAMHVRVRDLTIQLDVMNFVSDKD